MRAPHWTATLLLALAPLASAQTRDGWTVDTTLKTYSTVAVAADGDWLFATRFCGGDEAAVEVHRFDAGLGRYVVENTVRDPSWNPTHWRGFSAAADRSTCAIYSRPGFDPSGSVHVLERSGSAWSVQNVPLPGFTAIYAGTNVAIDGRRILTSRCGVFDEPELHILEPDASGTWNRVQALELSPLVVFPLENPSYLALDGDLALATHSLAIPYGHFVVCARDSVTGLWSEDQVLPLPRVGIAPAGVAVEDPRVVVGGHDGTDSFVWIFERTSSGQLVRLQEISRPGIGPVVNSNVVLERGRLLLSAGNSVHVFEPDSSGTFVETARYEGLGHAVAHTDGAQPGAGRIVGRSGRRARIAPYPLAPVPSGAPTFAVRQDFGVHDCHPTTPGAPELRLYSLNATDGARITGATPGSAIVTYASRAGGFLPATGGALCLERATMFLALLPTVASAGGETPLDLSASVLPTSFAIGEGFHLQSLVLDPGGPQLTNSVHFVR